MAFTNVFFFEVQGLVGFLKLSMSPAVIRLGIAPLMFFGMLETISSVP